MVEAFSGEVKVPVGLAGQGRAFGVGKLAVLGELSPRKSSGSNGGGRGGRWRRAACFGFRFILKKKKAFIIFSYYQSDTCLVWKFQDVLESQMKETH